MESLEQVICQRLEIDSLDALDPGLQKVCETIEREHPDFLENVLVSEQWLEADEEKIIAAGNKEQINADRARALAPHVSGCCWFRDPVKGHILLEKDEEWMINSLNPNIWLAFFNAFPTLTPEILSGPLTDIVAIHVEDTYPGRQFLKFLRESGHMPENFMRLRKGTDIWLCFSCPKIEDGWSLLENARGTNLEIGGQTWGESVKVLGLGTLVPIPNTIKFNPPDSDGLFFHEPVVQLPGKDGAKTFRTPVPGLLVNAFAQTPEFEGHRTARLYRKNPLSRDRVLELQNRTIKALKALPPGKIREKACENIYRELVSELREALGESGLKKLLKQVFEKSGCESSADFAPQYMVLTFLLFSVAGGLTL